MRKAAEPNTCKFEVPDSLAMAKEKGTKNAEKADGLVDEDVTMQESVGSPKVQCKSSFGNEQLSLILYHYRKSRGRTRMT